MAFLLAVYFTVVVNIPFYSALMSIFDDLERVKMGFVISIPLFLFSAFWFLFNLFTWPWITKPFFITLLILSAAVSYAGYNYGILFDADMVLNIVETDYSEVTSYLSLYSLMWIVAMGIVPALVLMFVRIENNRSCLSFLFRKFISMISSLCIIGGIAFFYYQDYASIGRNNSYLRQLIVPTQLVYSIAKYVNRTYFDTPIIYRSIGIDAKQKNKWLTGEHDKPTLMVFILGETARSQNYEMNGYERPTNKYTKSHGIISFQDVYSCGTATAVSVPCMFSILTRETYSRRKADSQDNWLDIMKRAGIDLFWIENDGGDKNVAKSIRKIEIDRNRDDDMCNGSTCFDLVMLENFEENIDSMHGNRMLLLHLIGSHGPTYFQRYPDEMKKFTPDCPRADIENCSVAQIINTYDNTILYTDFVISQTIERLKVLESKYNTALFYVSDHGESLGENGLFLHGLPYSLAPEEQIKVPMMVWMSKGFEKEKRINRGCLKTHAESRSYSHDNLFHSMLGIMDVVTEVYEPNMDLFVGCRD